MKALSHTWSCFFFQLKFITQRQVSRTMKPKHQLSSCRSHITFRISDFKPRTGNYLFWLRFSLVSITPYFQPCKFLIFLHISCFKSIIRKSSWHFTPQKQQLKASLNRRCWACMCSRGGCRILANYFPGIDSNKRMHNHNNSQPLYPVPWSSVQCVRFEVYRYSFPVKY